MTHEQLIEKAKEAISEIYTDVRVDKATTVDSLKEIRDEINVCLDALNNDC